MRSFLATSGNPLKSTALVTVKTVALTPIPSASVATATAVNSGFLRSVRKLRRTSSSGDILKFLHWRGLIGAYGPDGDCRDVVVFRTDGRGSKTAQHRDLTDVR